MNRSRFVLVSLFCVAVWSAPSAALEWECPEMKGFVTAMYEASEYLKEHPDFDENPGMEEDMDKVLRALAAIAEDEGDRDFMNSLGAAIRIWEKDAWSDADSAAFRIAFDSSAVNLERIHERYCD